MTKIKPRSSRRVPALKESDYDHEIKLVDHSAPVPRAVSPEDETVQASISEPEPVVAGPSSGATASQAPNDKLVDDVVGDQVGSSVAEDHRTLCTTIDTTDSSARLPGADEPQADKKTIPEGEEPIAVTRPKKSTESAIDILYENQRGGFLCGIPLFSSQALGNLDPTPWTNSTHRPSPTDIHTAQVPDPSWEWAWPEWRINHQDGVDDDGWEYSFMFAKAFSWHGPAWWNSFVRRRAWIRRRVKKDTGYLSQDPHLLNPEYFSIRASSDRDRDHSRSPSRDTSHRASKVSTTTAGGRGAGEEPGGELAGIETMDELLQVLRASRIDREKIEAVDRYLRNSEDDLVPLEEEMHEIMSLFVFQQSRRILLTKLTEEFDKAVAMRNEEHKGPGSLEQRVQSLSAAIKHADEEVRRLEYWSDIKGIAQEGDSEGAVDRGRGWDPAWQGLDKSGPKEPGHRSPS